MTLSANTFRSLELSGVALNELSGIPDTDLFVGCTRKYRIGKVPGAITSLCPLFCMALLRLQEDRPRFCGNTATVLKMHVARRMPRDKKSPVCRYSDALAPVRGRPVRYRPMAWPRKPRTFPRPLERRLRVLSRTPGPRNRCLRSPVLRRTLRKHVFRRER